jgi:hypothetical protein
MRGGRPVNSRRASRAMLFLHSRSTHSPPEQHLQRNHPHPVFPRILRATLISPSLFQRGTFQHLSLPRNAICSGG